MKWILASGRRLLLVIAATIIVIGFAASLIGDDTPPADTARVEAVPPPAAPTPAERTVGARDSARAFLTAFFAPQAPRWRALATRWATDAMAEHLDALPRGDVPRAVVRRVMVTGSTDTYAETTALLSTGANVHLTLVRGAGGWRADEIIAAHE